MEGWRNEMLLTQPMSPTSMVRARSNLQGQGLSLSLGTQIPPGIQIPPLQFRNLNPGFSDFPGPNQSISGQVNTRNESIEKSENPSPFGLPRTVSVISNSKYTKAAQQLLDEVVNVRTTLKQLDSNKNFQKSDLRMKDAEEDGDGSIYATSGGGCSNPQNITEKSCDLSPAERHDLQNKLTKLLSMLDEVDRRYRHYYHQMQIVISSFEAIVGCGASKPYTALTLQMISHHFRCLRDAIVGQIEACVTFQVPVSWLSLLTSTYPLYRKVTYVKKLNIPSGVVGACRLDLAYDHFKEKPHLFQFVPNEKQVKAANKLLKTCSQDDGQRRIDGVPVFSAQNLDIAIATRDGIKWYTPYFFDKNMLDNILEDSVDQHFQGLIQSRHMERRRDIIDDNMASDIMEENTDNIWEPPEVQEVIDELGQPSIPLSVISKAAEVQLLYAVDRVLLGNRWLRKATGIQPKFPYMVDSFERRSAISSLRSSSSTRCITNDQPEVDNYAEHPGCSGSKPESGLQMYQPQNRHHWFPFGDWFSHHWSKQQHQLHSGSDSRDSRKELQANPLLPKITMVGVSTGEAGQMNRASLKKTMEELTMELERTDHANTDCDDEYRTSYRDPLFVANVGDYYSGATKRSARWVRGST